MNNLCFVAEPMACKSVPSLYSKKLKYVANYLQISIEVMYARTYYLIFYNIISCAVSLSFPSCRKLLVTILVLLFLQASGEFLAGVFAPTTNLITAIHCCSVADNESFNWHSI